MTASPSIEALTAALKLPTDFGNIKWYTEVADAILAQHALLGRPMVAGLAGPQGSGKSTMARFLQLLLEQRGVPAVILSLDDFYLPHSVRAEQGRKVHPLLLVRGVPGTHEVERLVTTLDRLHQAGPGEVTWIPRFDKAQDDRLPQSEWHRYIGRADVVLLEGWCVGARPQPVSALEQPLNELESEEDPDGRWRRLVNDQLDGTYSDLFARLDFLAFLAAPSFDCVFAWRKLQEDKLRASMPASAGKLLRDEALHRFIMYYERITRHMLEEMPARADVVLQLDSEQQIVGIRSNIGAAEKG